MRCRERLRARCSHYEHALWSVEDGGCLCRVHVSSQWQGSDIARLARLCQHCLQYWGGMGFTADNPVARAYRDGRLGSIGGGADEIMLGIICKYEGTMPVRG